MSFLVMIILKDKLCVHVPVCTCTSICICEWVFCNEIIDLNNYVIEFSDFIIGLWVLFLFKESGRKVCAIRNQIHQKIALYLSINALNLNANGVKMGFYQGNFLYHYKED